MFAFFFISCGLCAGCYFPIAVGQLAASAFGTAQIAGKLAAADHLGASAGGLLTSLALVPVLGIKVSIFVFVVLILSNLPLTLLKIYKPQRFFVLAGAPRFRMAGYILLATGISVILCSNLIVYAETKLRPALSKYTAQSLAGQLQIKQVSAIIAEDSQKIDYYSVYDSNEQLVGYIFGSKDTAPQVRGFGGKINLAIYTDTVGELIDFHIIRSQESPAYLEMLTQWRELLTGRMLFSARPFDDVDTVTGATVSSEAILKALQKSGNVFARGVLGHTIQPGIKEEPQAYNLSDITGIYLITAFVLTLIVVYYGGFWTRLIVLSFNLVVGGIILNTQYSSEQIATILSLRIPAIGLSGAFILAVGIPILGIIFGNIYCGYICPFGAAQELFGFIIPRKYKPALVEEEMRKARFVKYVIFFILMMAFFVSRDRSTLVADPLISFFNLYTFVSSRDFFGTYNFLSPILLITAAALIGTVFYSRFWCRYLCPAGAFLSLFNKLVLLKRYLPAKKFGNCEFGLTGKDNSDCLYCDKCRFEKTIIKEKQKKTWNIFSLRACNSNLYNNCFNKQIFGGYFHWF
ncbi:MAG: 4Fe-4S binding protein [Planctomycetota bacterium]